MEEDKQKNLLESMIGTTVSRTAGVQVPVDCNLPVKFPMNTIHYELYKNHVELHIEGSNYKSLCLFLERSLKDDEISSKANRSFCRYAYILNREITGWKNIVELGDAIIELRNIVEPVLIAYCEQMVDSVELAKVLSDYYKEQKENLPFHVNVIDELHANENAHTRILTKLLKYRTDGKHIILSSFLSLISNFNEPEADVETSTVVFNHDFIDCLIECPRKFAVIIENKIHNAADQEKQIERYVLIEKSKGIPSEKIWAIYLTNDGNKKIDSCSLTDKAKGILEDRFISLNYRHDILPWLKDMVLPNCKLKEDWLISALKQYIDHLEGLYGLRSSQRELRAKMGRFAQSSLGLSNETSVSEQYSRLRDFSHSLGDLQNIIETTTNRLVKPVVEKLQDCTLEVLSNICPEKDIDFYNGLANGFFQVFISGWPRSVHFEWIPLNNRCLMCSNNYSMVVHVEDKKIEDYIERHLNDDKAFCSNAVNARVSKVCSRTYYRKSVDTPKSIAEMTHSELCEFLKAMYIDVPILVNFIEKSVLKGL